MQVLTPMKAGPAGTRSLNLRLQALLNPPDPSRPEFQRRPNDTTAVFRVGDRVIQVRTHTLATISQQRCK